MKIKFLSLFFLLVFETSLLLALDNYPFSVGASISGKMGINAASVPSGLQNAISILGGVDAAVLAYMPMSDDTRTGVFLEIGYTNTPFGLKQYGTGNNQTSYLNQKWLTISPIILMSGVAIGLEFGFNAFEDEVDKKYFMFGNMPRKPDFNVSLRVGYMYPIFTNHIGSLNFHINATYNITGSDYGDNTYSPATMSLGLNYLFNLETDER